ERHFRRAAGREIGIGGQRVTAHAGILESNFQRLEHLRGSVEGRHMRTFAGEHHRGVTEPAGAGGKFGKLKRGLTPETGVADRKKTELHEVEVGGYENRQQPDSVEG